MSTDRVAKIQLIFDGVVRIQLPLKERGAWRSGGESVLMATNPYSTVQNC
jgi:hypothetical protein